MGGLNLGGGAPFGLAYALGQAGKDIGQGMVQGQMNAPRLEAQNIQNQQAGLNLQKSQYDFEGTQSANKALGSSMANVNAEDPYENMKQMSIAKANAAQKLAAAGRGDLAAPLLKDANDLKQNAHQLLFTRVSDAARTRNVGALKQIVPELGYGDIADIKVNGDNFDLYGEGNKKVASIPIEELSMLNAGPHERIPYLAKKYATEMGYQGRVEAAGMGLEGKQYAADEATKRSQQRMEMLDKMWDKRNMTSENVARIRGSMQQQLAQLKIYNPSNPDLFMLHNLTANGSDPASAYQWLQETKAAAQGKDPQTKAVSAVAGIDRALTTFGGKGLPAETQSALVSQYAQEFGRGKSPAPPVSTPQPGQSKPYAGRVMDQAKFGKLSPTAQVAFKNGGGIIQ